MSGTFKQKKVGKFFAIFVLVGFLGFSALSSLMYFTSPKDSMDSEKNKLECEELEGFRDEDILDCVFDEEVVEIGKTQESCEQHGGTRYEANEVCFIED